MRVARLPDDNLRTQGAERRAWYLSHSPHHLDAVARLIEDATRRAPPDAHARAVVLGAGACTEVPLAVLARLYRSVTLVDLDSRGMERARAEVPQVYRERVTLISADISGGVSASLARELASQPWADLAALTGKNGTAPLDAAAGCLQRTDVPDPPAIGGLEPGAYSLVISTLVLTQLFNLPLLDVVDTLTVHVPWAVDLRETHERYRAAATRFRRRLALAHLHLIARLLAPTSTAVFITDVTGYLLSPRAGPHAGPAEESLAVLPADALRLPDDLMRDFSLPSAPQHWRWTVHEPGPAQPGRAYDVFGTVLMPRNAADAK